MKTIYRFYVEEDEESDIIIHSFDHSPTKEEKEEMTIDILTSFPEAFLCTREKEVNGKLIYRNGFFLEPRRQDKFFISNYNREL